MGFPFSRLPTTDGRHSSVTALQTDGQACLEEDIAVASRGMTTFERVRPWEEAGGKKIPPELPSMRDSCATVDCASPAVLSGPPAIEPLIAEPNPAPRFTPA